MSDVLALGPEIFASGDGKVIRWKGQNYVPQPRVMTTVDELDALGFKATVLDADQHIWVNDGDSLDQWGSVTHPESYGGPKWLGSADIALPATVLWEPQP